MKHLISLLLCLICTHAVAQTPVEYAYGPDPLQRFDLYQPANAQDAPIFVMLHGGGWRFGDKANTRVWRVKVGHWVPQGALVISVNTRLMPTADPIDQTRDLGRALAMIQQNAVNWGGDPDKIILMGHSAGAHVAALLATRNDIRQTAGLHPLAGTILLDSASLDVQMMMHGDPTRLHRNAFGNDPAFWQAASPATHVSRNEGPFLIICSAQRATACPNARSFGAAATARGNSVTIMPVALSHMDINARLGEPNSYTAAIDNWIAARN